MRHVRVRSIKSQEAVVEAVEEDADQKESGDDEKISEFLTRRTAAKRKRLEQQQQQLDAEHEFEAALDRSVENHEGGCWPMS